MSPKRRDLDDRSTWRPPTRRAFVGMIGAAAAALAIRQRAPEAAEATEATEARNLTARPRWIGHC